MAMDGAMNFLSYFEDKLAEEIPAVMMTKVMRIAADVLTDFEVIQTRQEEKKDDDLMEYYAQVLSIQGRSQKTIDRYRYVISRMLNAVKMPTRKITVYHLRSYLASEKKRGISDSTLEGYREVYSAFFGWLHKESMIETNPTANLGKIKVPKKKKRVFTDVEMERLFRACKTKRERAIVAFLDSTACRISEMTDLNVNDIDYNRKKVIVHGKGDKERTVILTDVAMELLKEYLDERGDKNEALFVSMKRPNRRMLPGGIRIILNDLGKRAGVEHVHPHKFRRSRETRLSQHGTDLPIIQKYLGHDKPETTMKYVILDEEDMENAVRRCS